MKESELSDPERRVKLNPTEGGAPATSGSCEAQGRYWDAYKASLREMLNSGHESVPVTHRRGVKKRSGEAADKCSQWLCR